MMRYWHKNTIKAQYIFIILLLLVPIMVQAEGVFDRIYKLPNAQTATADNNYQPNVYFLPSTQPTTQEGKQALALLKANNKNKTIQSNVKQITQLLLKAEQQNDPVAQGIQATIYYYGWHTLASPQAAYVMAQKASQQGEGQGDLIISKLLDTNQVSTQQDISYSLNQIHKNKPKANIVLLPNGQTKDLGIVSQAAKGIALLSAQSKNPVKAKLQRVLHYIKQGVENNHAQSQYLYGNSITKGNFKPIGLLPDNKTELTYIIKAADQGWPNAINDASALYSVMRGMIDRTKANQYAQQLIDTKDMHYDKAWTMMIKNLFLNNQKDESKALLDQGWELSKQSSASLAAFHAYFIEYKTKQGRDERIKWAKTANRLQNPKINEFEVGNVFRIIGTYYLQKEVGIKVTEAKKWLDRAVIEGNDSAFNTLGLICKGIYGGKKDMACAIKNYKKGVAMLDPFAMQSLATSYYLGEGVAKNHKKVFELTQKAAKMGQARSMWLLASAYHNSIGVKRDDAQCHVWASLANIRQWQPKVTAQLKQQCGRSVSAGQKASLQQAIQQLNSSLPASQLDKITIFN